MRSLFQLVMMLTAVAVTNAMARQEEFFGSSFPFESWFGGMAWPGREQFTGPRIDTINNPKQVYQLIRESQKNAT